MSLPPSACDLPGLPRDDAGPVFSAPWQAQAFALALALHERGAFTWSEWATALSQAIQRAQQQGDRDLGDTYYRHWLDALERLVISKGLADADRLHALEHAWEAAAARTPHGQPIELSAAELALAEGPGESLSSEVSSVVSSEVFKHEPGLPHAGAD